MIKKNNSDYSFFRFTNITIFKVGVNFFNVVFYNTSISKESILTILWN